MPKIRVAVATAPHIMAKNASPSIAIKNQVVALIIAVISQSII
jgi:hypothetical protein